MKKTILITGSTDGIGLETAKLLATKGHNIILHGRSATKLQTAEQSVSSLTNSSQIETYLADFARLQDVQSFANAIQNKYEKIDVLINNAGIFKTSVTTTQYDIDVRFVVNTISPYLLTKSLLPLFAASGRVINLSSAAQSSVNIDALTGSIGLSDSMAAYSQSKLALTMWSYALASVIKAGPSIITINPGSMLASKMVQESFGVVGNDIKIGAEILDKAALDNMFLDASGKYFDNDVGQFSSPHPDALDSEKCDNLVAVLEELIIGLVK